MKTKLVRMRCGNCGKQSFEVFTRMEDTHGIDGITNLFVECMGCRSVSVIRPFMPLMTVGWGEGSEGILCVFPKDEKCSNEVEQALCLHSLERLNETWKPFRYRCKKCGKMLKKASGMLQPRG
jgi:uncharacterized Zn finger protein